MTTSHDPRIGPTDRVLIDQPESARWWASHFSVTVEQLQGAVLAVGPMPTAVGYFLRQVELSRPGRMKPRPAQPRERPKRRTRARTDASPRPTPDPSDEPT